MWLLIDKSTGRVLRSSVSPTNDFGGQDRWDFDDGIVAWAEIPPGELFEDCDIVPGPTPTIVLNAAKKAVRLDELSNFQIAKQTIRDYDDDTATPAQMKLFRKAVRFVLRRMTS